MWGCLPTLSVLGSLRHQPGSLSTGLARDSACWTWSVSFAPRERIHLLKKKKMKAVNITDHRVGGYSGNQCAQSNLQLFPAGLHLLEISQPPRVALIGETDFQSQSQSDFGKEVAWEPISLETL